MPTTATTTRSTCPYCGAGCGAVIEHDAARVTGVRGDPEHPANFGKLCTKGSTLHLTATPMVRQHARALYPEMRGNRCEARARVEWGAVLVLRGFEPIQFGHREKRRPDQPAPCYRADRPARRRAVFAHRPAQRHGRP